MPKQFTNRDDARQFADANGYCTSYVSAHYAESYGVTESGWYIFDIRTHNLILF